MTTEDYYKWVILDQIRILKSGKDSEESRKPKDFVEEDAGGRFVFLNVDKLDLGEILRIIQEQPHADDDARIYMDLTGGTRVTSMTGIMLCRWLEVINYKLICAIYCDINGKVGTIKDITDIYGLFNAIIAHEKMYDPHLQHVSAENEAESAAYGLVEYRNNIAKKPACLKADSSGEPFIFISYSHMDHYPCQAIIQRLQSWGYRVWYDEGIGWGDYWEKTLKDHMDQCRMAIVLLSDHYIKSEYCNKELENLREKKKYVIRLGNVNPDNAYLEQNPFFEKEQSIPLLIDNKAEFTEKLKEGIEKLPEAVETRKSENK